MSSLLDYFDSILNPREQDSDDNFDVDTAARIEPSSFHGEIVDSNRSSLRLKTQKDLHLLDEKYSGKVVKRKEIFSDNEDEDIESDISTHNVDANDTQESDVEEESDSNASSGVSEDIAGKQEEGADIFHKQTTDALAEGKAIRQQFVLWDKLMAVRIRLQAVMVLVNKLDNGQKAGPEVRNTLKSSLTALLDIEQLIEDKLKSSNKNESQKNEDDDEISSSEGESPIEDPGKSVGSRKRKGLGWIQEELGKKSKNTAQIRDDTIKKWDMKTRLGVTKSKHDFSAFQTGAIEQIKTILEQKSRLISRTQIDRSLESAESEVTNVELFDDSDFYQQLLRELIESKSALSQDSSDTARNYALLQKMQQKKKNRNVDTKASKARKLRYTVHNKLVNFVAPYDNSEYSTQAIDYLFDSLFAK